MGQRRKQTGACEATPLLLRKRAQVLNAPAPRVTAPWQRALRRAAWMLPRCFSRPGGRLFGSAGSVPEQFGYQGQGSGEATCLDVAMSTRDSRTPELQVYRCNWKDGQLFLVQNSGVSSLPQIKWAADP